MLNEFNQVGVVQTQQSQPYSERVEVEKTRFFKSARIKAMELAWEDERAKSDNHYVDQTEALKKADIYYAWLTQ